MVCARALCAVILLRAARERERMTQQQQQQQARPVSVPVCVQRVPHTRCSILRAERAVLRACKVARAER